MRTRKVKVRDLNPHVCCALCGGYFVDATTIIECLHSFCKTCIVPYLEASGYCPVCDVQVHSSNPFLGIRYDQTLQDLVYKLVPGLLTREINRRKDFYFRHPNTFDPEFPVPGISSPSMSDFAYPTSSALPSSSDSVAESVQRQMTHGKIFYTEEEKISLSLEFSPDGKPNAHGHHFTCSAHRAAHQLLQTRYLLCPSRFTIRLLKKFLRMKLGLPAYYKIDVFHTDESLSEEYSLMDVAYIYSYRGTTPLRVFYSVYETKPQIDQLSSTCQLRHTSNGHVASTTNRSSASRRPEQESLELSGLRFSPLHPPADTDSCVDSKAGIKLEPGFHGRSRSRKPAKPVRWRHAPRPAAAQSTTTSAATTITATSTTTGTSATNAAVSPLVVVKKEADDSSSSGSVGKKRYKSIRVRIPRSVLDGIRFTCAPRSNENTSSAAMRSSKVRSRSTYDSGLSGTSSADRSSDLYDFDEEDEPPQRVLPFSLVRRRRYSDSSWSS